MGKRLYVGNLPYDADEDSIREAFAAGGGTVERVHIPLDRETQRPRGFAFVDMASDAEAKAALAAMNGVTMGSRTLRVSEAEDRRPAAGGAGGGGGGGGGSGGPRPDRAERPVRQDGGSPRPRAVDPAGRGSFDGGRDGGRPQHFGPDSKPMRERERERERERRGSRRRPGDDEGDFHGRRGRQRFDEDEDE